MAKYIFKRKGFSIYDETDNLKRMKDADILSEKKKDRVGIGKPVGGALSGAAIGAGVGTVATAGAHLLGKAKGTKVGKAATGAAIVGSLIGLSRGAKNRKKENSEIDFYNSRLDYAKSQARRRERKDWKSNMTQRDGYSY